MKNKFLFCTLLSFCLTQTAWSAVSENNQINAALKAKLADKILTEDEIMQGADQTQTLYIYCIQETAGKLKMMYPNVDQKTLVDTVNSTCEYPEDRFNVYSVLLAASNMKKPMSEKQAAVFVENNYVKEGRDKNNAAQRVELYGKLGLLKK